MKVLKNILLLAICLMNTACGGENLEAYKDKVLETFANRLGTTKELLVKDYDVIVDSMSVTPITVADSIAIINLWKGKQGEIEKSIELKRLNLKSIFNFNVSEDRKLLKTMESRLKEIQESDKILEKYTLMKSDKVLGKIFICRISSFFPLLGRKTGFGGVIFDKEGICIMQEDVDEIIVDYFKQKMQK